jgi:hypothetical protein
LPVLTPFQTGAWLSLRGIYRTWLEVNAPVTILFYL